MVDALRHGNAKVTAENKDFEGQLKARRKAFADQVAAYEAAVAGLEAKVEVVKRDLIASEVRMPK